MYEELKRIALQSCYNLLKITCIIYSKARSISENSIRKDINYKNSYLI